MTKTVLIVDDDPVQRRLHGDMITKIGYRSIAVDGGKAAFKILDGGSDGDIDLMLLDLQMPEIDGLGVLAKIKPQRPNLPVIVVTAHAGIEHVVKAMRAGAVDFVVKPVSLERLQVSVENALQLKSLVGEVTRLQRRATGQIDPGDIVGKSQALTKLLAMSERAAQSNIPVLIEGESGVGKELIARYILSHSERAQAPFVAVNCATIPDNLVESILFGHEKGSFTGAIGKHIGKFQEADGGTLFLDEIAELKLDMQVKLLRALQEGEIDPVGGRQTVKVNVRMISATNRDLTKLIASSHFREDLYYRINMFPLQVPPLRDRKDDIPELVDYFMQRFGATEGRKIKGVTADALARLADYHWPGNIRQLENAVFRAVVLSDADVLSSVDFPQVAQWMGIELQEGPPPTASPRPTSETDHPATAVAPAGPVAMLDNHGHVRPLEQIEGDVIRYALEHYEGQMSKVARHLGIGRSTLYRKVRELGLEPEEAEA
ncbi:MAG: sigma-54-dependent Fis family transcriptional regulator [Alphaproteobacteria bacterium]|nr:sigma-54-dependent Fis family transcriptional regulator [Alphaproteobacteria bacterium]